APGGGDTRHALGAGGNVAGHGVGLAVGIPARGQPCPAGAHGPARRAGRGRAVVRRAARRAARRGDVGAAAEAPRLPGAAAADGWLYRADQPVATRVLAAPVRPAAQEHPDRRGDPRPDPAGPRPWTW